MKKDVNAKTYFFDLDGTIVDSQLGIFNAVIYALKGLDILVHNPQEELTRFIGPPLVDSFREHYRLSPEQCDFAVSRYRDYYGARGMRENSVYAGMPQLLQRLSGAGAQLLVATSKPTFFAEEILKQQGLEGYFFAIVGATLDATRSHKRQVLEHALERSGLQQPADAAMIGDRKYDMQAAGQLGIRAIGVSYGYGSVPELEQAGASVIAHSVSQLAQIL